MGTLTTKKRGRVKLPRHFRYYAGDSQSLCGLVGGRNGKGYRKITRTKPDKWGRKWEWVECPSDVPYSRLNCKLEQTTCEHCLMNIIQHCKRQLRARLAEVGKTALQAGRERRVVATVSGLRRLTGS